MTSTGLLQQHHRCVQAIHEAQETNFFVLCNTPLLL